VLVEYFTQRALFMMIVRMRLVGLEYDHSDTGSMAAGRLHFERVWLVNSEGGVVRSISADGTGR
jgi:hypothetical protein